MPLGDDVRDARLRSVQKQEFAKTLAMMSNWDAEHRPISCANCRHAIVIADLDRRGDATALAVRCERGQADFALPLWSMIRPDRPRNFVPPGDCPSFSPMGETEVGTA